MSFHNYDRPKNGRVFRCIGVGRISTAHQDELSLADQESLYRRHLEKLLKGWQFEVTCIASRGSGQVLDREEYRQLCDMVASGEFDLVIAEDLGRICRRMQAYTFCEDGEDTQTRIVAINDFIDTAESGWQQATFFASFKHESFCRDTSKRIRRSLRNRFEQGGVFQCEIFGYVKPHPHANDSEVYKESSAEPIYDEWFNMLESGRSYREVADWLNEKNVATGPHCRQVKWDGKMVARITHNPLIKGERRRNDRVTIRTNKTGKSKTIPAPEAERLSRQVPHLAFIEPERYDLIIRQLKKRNAKYRRSESEKNDPRAGIPKRSTQFPGQLCRCGVCGRLFVFGGHGKKDRLMCNGARDHSCWNAMTISGPDVAKAVSIQIREFIQNMEGFDAEWLSEYEAQRKSFSVEKNGQLEQLNKELASANRKLANQSDALDKIGASDSIVVRIKELDAIVLDLKDKISVAKKALGARPELPSLDEIRSVCDEVFNELSLDSVEFANVMRKSISDFYVLPYRLADGGHVQPRVVFRVSLASILPGLHADLPILQFDGMVDLAKQPCRVLIREDVVAMVDSGMKHADIAAKLGVTKTEVSNAMALHRCMVANDLSDPWVQVTSVDQVRDYFKRVRNPRFKFQPLEGFEETKHPRD